MIVVAAVIERGDRRILIGQRRKDDTSALKWEFPGGKVRHGETLERALARELHEELGVTMGRCKEIAEARAAYSHYSQVPEELEIHFFAAEYAESEIKPVVYELVVWALPKELAEYDFLKANRELVADLATGRIKPREVLEEISRA
jgi:8-oxo-dGTP diphosphatase